MTHLNNDTDTYGAKRASRREINARSLVQRLIDENPGLSRAENLALFLEEMERPVNKKYLPSILEYFHSNHFNSLAPEQVAGRKVRARSGDRDAGMEAADREYKDEVKTKIKERATRMVLLDLVMPNGKMLRNCTGKEVAKSGEIFARIAGQIKPNEVVGDVLSEAQVRKLCGR